MMRSLFSGVAGLKTHQTRMDVIGNNIANVNTVGYKSQTVQFSDVLYQTTQSSSGPNEDTGKGGTNANQIGLGSKVAAMSSNVAQAGGAQSTNNPFDLMINGDSMFVVSDGTTTFFTRAGNFTTDANGSLVTSSGNNVMGWLADDEGNIQVTNVKPLSVYGAAYKSASPKQTTGVTLSGNINKEDESFENGGARYTNISFYDNLGYEYVATIRLTQTDATGFNYALTVSNISCDGNDITDNFTEAQLQAFLGNNATIGFNAADGSLTTPNNGELTFNTNALGANFAGNVIIDCNNLACYGSDTTIAAEKGIADADGTVTGAGRYAGEMTSVSIQTDGKIVAAYSNGENRVIGQIVVANFTNLSGLEKAGENLYTATLNSGEFNGIGDDITANGGSFASGYVEMSNVDLAAEFTDMITTQRGFQANSRIITVSDTMLEELINLKR